MASTTGLHLLAVLLVLSYSSYSIHAACFEENADGYCTLVANDIIAGKENTCDETLNGYQCLFCPCTCLNAGDACGSLKYKDTGGSGNGGGGGEDPIDFGESETEAPTGVGKTRVPTTSSPTAAPFLPFGEGDFPTPAPTGQPSPAPTDTKTTTCAANCGEVERGGGTCNENDPNVCTSCNSDRFLATGRLDGNLFGRCVGTLKCRARVVQSGAVKGGTCKCEDRVNCDYCFRTASGDTCQRCKNGKYFLDNKCVDSCVEANLTHSGVSLWGRRCEEEFTCVSGRNTATAAPCKCTTITDGIKGANGICLTCAFEATRFGEKCLRCKGGLYHNPNSNTCEKDCSGFGLNTLPPDGYIAYKVGSYGAACRKPFTCSGKRDEDGEKCKCSKDVGKNDCLVCTWSFNGNKCIQCTNDKYLHQGQCINECPQGTTSVGTTKVGRECQ